MMIEAGRFEGKLMGSPLISVPVPEKQAQPCSPRPTHLPLFETHAWYFSSLTLASHPFEFILLE